MTQDEIIRMAREADDYAKQQCTDFPIAKFQTVRDKRFAALVAAHVTETLTKAHEAAFQSYVDQAKVDRELEALAARLDEREACALMVDKLYHGSYMRSIRDCAAAIRARGEK